MSAYLARLKQLEGEKISQHTPEGEPSKPSKAPFEPFEGTGTGHIVKKFHDEKAAKAPKAANEEAENLALLQQKERRQKVIAMLEAAPDTQRAIYADTDSDPHNVILAVAVRACMQTCELLIPKDKYDPWRLLELIERHGTTLH